MIAGIRGIPAQHGGFETFAERLALHLVARGWKVSVFCQEDGLEEAVEKEWRGVRRVLIPVRSAGPFGTIVFDWKCTLKAARGADLVLVLGYNTAMFSFVYRLRGVKNFINMDGIEWRRKKWNWWQKCWLYVNERIAGVVATKLIADNPEIKNHLARGALGRKDVAVIPYGADDVSGFPAAALKDLGLEARKYVLVIARPEPENQILEIVEAFSACRRGKKLVVLGKLEANSNRYHRAVIDAASEEVVFPGAIYAAATVSSLRANAALYVHGHTVGGTNPSLVEALGAAAAVLAHDNIFNRWVARGAARYFRGKEDCRAKLEQLLDAPEELEHMRSASLARFDEAFRWEDVLEKYERLLGGACRAGGGAGRK